ncbi:MAG: FecR domain-containing protein [Betaproteobacteria bacterium]|nr:FecR domain-containing protein [Betaproteobacteria bacterium]
MNTLKAVCLALLLGAVALPAWAQSIGRVLVASGEVTVVRGSTTQPATAGLALQVGDRVRTGAAGTTQLWFTDTSIVALRNGSDFVVERYSFTNSLTDNLVFNLVRGGYRTVAGLIGVQDRKAYQIKTKMATLGRRGTQYGIVYCEQDCPLPEGGLAPDGLYGGVYDGRVSVANNTPEVVFGRDEYFYIASINSIPQPLLGPPAFFADRLAGLAKNAQKPATEPPASASSASAPTSDVAPSSAPTPPAYTATENRVGGGTPAVVARATEFPLPRAFLNGLHVGQPGGVQTRGGGGILNPGTLLVDTINGLPAMIRVVNGTFGAVVGSAGIDMQGSDATSGVVWGRWINGIGTASLLVPPFSPNPSGPFTGFHYMYGTPTTDTVIAAKSGFATYADIGGTTPTSSNGETATGFAFGPLSIDFTARLATLTSVTMTFPTSTWSFGSQTYAFVFNENGGNGAVFRGDTNNAGSCVGTGCGAVQGPGTARGSMVGIFFGANGDRVGLSFHGTSGNAVTAPNLVATAVRIFGLQAAPPVTLLFANSLIESNGSVASYGGGVTGPAANLTFNGSGPSQTLTAFNFPQFTYSGAAGGGGISGAGFDSDSGVYYGRWISGSITSGSAQAPQLPAGTQTSGMGVHYLYGTPTPDSVIAAKTGSAQYLDHAGTFPTASNGESSNSYNFGPININFTNRTGVITSAQFSFPTSSWNFSNLAFNINVTPGQGASFDANLANVGSCVGSGCGPVQGSNTARADFFGRFIGNSGNFLGLSFGGNSGGNTPSGNPNLTIGVVRVFKCPTCP